MKNQFSGAASEKQTADAAQFLQKFQQKFQTTQAPK